MAAVMVLFRKIKLVTIKTTQLPLYILAIPAVLIIRLIKPWLLVRMCKLYSSRIGHFATNTELYLCERDAGINVPNQRYIDIFYMRGLICNQQLATMWNRGLRVWPGWIWVFIHRLNRVIPGAKLYEIDSTHGRDIHNLLDRFPAHLQFTAKEEARGEAGLRLMGLPPGSEFVCLNVRDSAYLAGPAWSYHSYRDSDIQNYVLAAEALTERGYFVIRMGAKVHEPIKSAHPKVIDYATNGMRSDFMDIYLGAKCVFCISTGTGWDCIPEILGRRPIVYVNIGPVGGLPSYRKWTISIVKHHFSLMKNRKLSMPEIFTHGLGFLDHTSDYETKGVALIENTPEEIRDVAIEMADRLTATWQTFPGDEMLQQSFYEIFLTGAVDSINGKSLHGEIRSRFGAVFLRNNPEWLQ
jgi:putative glycosyltransferase (TIGR04372 family)